ncbi:enolase C-terminal domain-like protein [Pseudomonas sp. PCH446]
MKLHETTYAAIAAARAALPVSVGELMVDVNCPWTRAQACDMAEQLRVLELGWLEEPVWPPDDVSGLAQVRCHGVAISAGENAAGVNGIRALVEQGAVDVLQPSVAKVGASARCWRSLRLPANTLSESCPLLLLRPGLLAVAHLCTLLPADVALEVPFIEFERLLYPELAFTPRMSLPDVPGLGFVPDVEVLRTYCTDHALIS